MSQPLEYTPLDQIPIICKRLNEEFMKGTTLPVAHRKNQLRSIGYMLQDCRDELIEALYKDQERPKFETIVHEINFLIEEIHEALTSLDEWVKPLNVSTKFPFNFTSPKVYREPKGRALVIGSWNYPISLSIGPVIGAIAAGCTVLLKPSEGAPNVASLLTKLLKRYLYDPHTFQIVNGAVQETSKVLKIDGGWDHILYTGSTRVGRIIAESAAKNLTPVTLELGGKSPVIICDDADIKEVAQRVFLFRVVNSGQTCIAPDYVLCPSHLQPSLIEEIKKFMKKSYPENWISEQGRGKASKLANEAQFERVKNILTNTKGEILLGGEFDKERQKIQPALIRVEDGDAVMNEEIFGPILGLVTKETLDEAIEFVNSRPHPLAIYVFTKDQKKIDYVRTRTRSGAILGNVSVIHFAVPGLPFGGIGESGMGRWHGKAGFDSFTYERSTLNAPKWFKFILGKMTPPYTESNFKMMSNQVPKITKSTGEISLIRKLFFGNTWFLIFIVAILGVSKKKELEAVTRAIVGSK